MTEFAGAGEALEVYHVEDQSEGVTPVKTSVRVHLVSGGLKCCEKCEGNSFT